MVPFNLKLKSCSLNAHQNYLKILHLVISSNKYEFLINKKIPIYLNIIYYKCISIVFSYTKKKTCLILIYHNDNIGTLKKYLL